MTIQEMIDKVIAEGYSAENTDAKVCQDIVLKGIADSSLSRNATIKGGVVMRSLSKNARRATQDLDIDFIKYSLGDESVQRFIRQINCVPGITIEQIGEIKELKQQDYHGKRVFVKITDGTGDSITSKIDLGVHKLMEISQEEYCFDIAFSKDGACLLINTKEQMLTEKLRSLLRFGTISTRYKDIFDMWYLSKMVDKDLLKECVRLMIFEDETMREKSMRDIVNRVEEVLSDVEYVTTLKSSKKNWTDANDDTVISETLRFIKSL
ncbi:MAG: nucleotidyl transferase AbiEii/AbiGii toxin family protein [Bacillota bacterium]|nr:nucleotidyl transferase AbiEii/AbiGii toxin family protein [Bacillota bacterium]